MVSLESSSPGRYRRVWDFGAVRCVLKDGMVLWILTVDFVLSIEHVYGNTFGSIEEASSSRHDVWRVG